MRRAAALAILGLAAICLAGCLSYGSVIESVPLTVTSERGDLLVYLVRRDEYRADFQALEGTPAQLASVLADKKSAFVADGQVIRHASGNFMMVWFCGTKVKLRPVQLSRAQSGTQRYEAVCPA